MRPVPDAAAQIAVEQIGSRLRLAWSAPSQNRDGSRDKLELSEVRVLRRVLDLDALVKAQTHPAPANPAPKLDEQAPPTETSAEASPEPGAKPSAAAAAAPAPEVPPASSEPPPGPEEPQTEPNRANPDQTPAGPPTPGAAPANAPTGSAAAPEAPTPQVTFPPFEGEAVVVATQPASEPGAPAFYEDPVDPAWMGKRVEYAVVYANRKKRVSPVSAKVQIDPVPALDPPARPVAEVGDGVVTLSWPPVAGMDRGYLVFRRSATSPETAPSELEKENEFPETPIAAPLQEPSFDDRGIEFGVSICYATATVLLPPPPATPVPEPETAPKTEAQPQPQPEPATAPAPAPAAEQEKESGAEVPPAEVVPVVPPIAKPPRIRSPLSEEVCVTPEDHFPPPVPTGLVAVPSGEGNLLTWRAVEARDLRGYRIYDATAAGGPFELIAEVETPTYTDAEAPAGAARFYAVTAIDNSPGANESDKSEIASATRPQPQ